jgi:DNA repair exonuclease SbcCD nuclease subunit
MSDEQVKVLFVGDPHFKIKNIEHLPIFISSVTRIVESNNFDFVVVAGDLLDNHDRVDVEPLNYALKFLDSIRKTKTFVLVGNHDYKNNQQFLTDHHWMNALKHWSNLTVVDDVCEYNGFLFVPYVPPGRFLEAINTKYSDELLPNFYGVFAHQEFYGCKMGAIESKCGDKWNVDWPVVVSGHIHCKQWSQSNVYYPGSAMQHAFGQSVDNTVSVLTWSKSTRSMSYEELDLDMPKLTIKYLSVAGVMEPLKFEQTDLKKYKIVVQGNQNEFEIFKKNKRYKDLLQDGFKVVFKIKDNGQMACCPSIVRKKFTEVLRSKVAMEQDAELDVIHETFMGKLTLR